MSLQVSSQVASDVSASPDERKQDHGLKVAERNDDRRGLCAGFYAELLLCPLDMKMHGCMRDVQNLANVGIGLALEHPSQTIDLAGRQQPRSRTGLALPA